MAAKLKKGDKIIVLAGKDKGKEGEISKINPSTGKAIVEGVNIAIRHIKQSQNTQGGKVPQPMPIQISNLSLVDANGKLHGSVSKLLMERKLVLLRQQEI